MQLYGLGSNGNHQLSLDHCEDVSQPNLCVLPEVLKDSDSAHWDIQCGGNHTLLLVGGKLYGCGSNEHNQLGLSSSHSLGSFRQIHSHVPWKLARCGFDYSILVTVSNEIFSMGRNDKGALGQGSIIQTETLRRISVDMSGRQIVSLAASLNHVVMILSDHTIWGWGSARKGGLGQQTLDAMSVPTRIEICPVSEIPRQLALGKDWTFVITDKAMHYAGPKSRWNIPPQENHYLSSIAAVKSNWSTLHLLLNEGTIISCGRNDRGQYSPPGLPCLRVLMSGSEHSVGLDDHGNAFVWGWNEHGNCGPGTADVKDVRKLAMPRNMKFIGCAAGYGTTFLWCND